MSEQVLLKMKNIHKRFPGVYALKNVDYELRSGEVHALLGENGAGKSTLIKVLGGIYIADEGEIFIEGKKVELKGVKDAQKNGISIAFKGGKNKYFLSERISYIGKRASMGGDLYRAGKKSLQDIKKWTSHAWGSCRRSGKRFI